MQIQKRNGTLAEFDSTKIENAVILCILRDADGNLRGSPNLSASQRDLAKKITAQVVEVVSRRALDGVIYIEDVQDQVELALMRSGEHKYARDYVLYRERRKAEREAANATQKKETVANEFGNLDLSAYRNIITTACTDRDMGWELDPEPVYAQFHRSLYVGIQSEEVEKALIMAARPLIEKDPRYSYVAARFLARSISAEAMGKPMTPEQLEAAYPQYFVDYIRHGIAIERLDPRLEEFDLQVLGAAIVPSRDNRFQYQGLQILYDRYLIHEQGRRIEMPQALWMRVAMGLALLEEEKERRAIEFYNVLSTFRFVSSTPTLFNSGTIHPQLSSCFLTTVPDDLEGIYDAIKENALLSKYSGGLGNDWTPVRAMGSYIKGTNGKSQGVIPFLKVVNDTAVAVNQGGKRKGAVCAYLETWHLDIEEFLELRKNTGDDRRRTHDMNTANWIPDLFMERVGNGGEWTLFSPNEVPDLHDLTGNAFRERYEHYERLADTGEITLFKRLPAITLWRKMLTMLFETGHPWITFKDPCNLRNPQQHVGVVHSSNLCTEITLNSGPDETAVCNLGSINLLAHILPGQEMAMGTLRESLTSKEALDLIDREGLWYTVQVAMRMLDNVIDINFYPTEKARKANTRHRAVGLGVMGFADALHQLRIPMDSQAAVQFADTAQEVISFQAINASTELARERCPYSSFHGSLWEQGILPIDSLSLLEENRPGLHLDKSMALPKEAWEQLRQKAKQGMRNSNCMAIAPTATISNIIGVSQGIDPIYQNLYVKSNLSGEFTIVNWNMYQDLSALGVWDEVMVNDLKYFEGSLRPIDRVPQWAKRLYATAFEIDPQWLVRMAAARQKWIDQAVSLNLYMAEPSGRKIDNLYRLAWSLGLKTTYYLRTLGATAAEKSTVDRGTLNAVIAAPKVCSITDPDCEACQ